jgi:hypothetical protein
MVTLKPFAVALFEISVDVPSGSFNKVKFTSLVAVIERFSDSGK